MVKVLISLNSIKFSRSITTNNFATIVKSKYKIVIGFVKLANLMDKVSNSVKIVMTTNCINIQSNTIWALISLLLIKIFSHLTLFFSIISGKIFTMIKREKNLKFNKNKRKNFNLYLPYQCEKILNLHRQLHTLKCQKLELSGTEIFLQVFINKYKINITKMK